LLLLLRLLLMLLLLRDQARRDGRCLDRMLAGQVAPSQAEKRREGALHRLCLGV
jgi:hypothetical protein